MSVAKYSTVTIALLALAGCNQAALPDLTTTGSVFASTKSAAYNHTIAEKRPVQEAFVKLPENAGNIVDVVQRRHANGVQQTVTYAGDFETRGENAVRVRLVVKSGWSKRDGGKLRIIQPTLGAVAREMRKSLPGVSMRVSNELHKNAYGPFGYALGRASGNVACIYGWQHLKGNRNKFSEIPFINATVKKPELSMRMRVCKHGATARQLVDLMRYLRIDADPSRALNPGRVAWNSAPEGQMSLTEEGFVPGGYVSDPVLPNVVEERQPIATKPVLKRKRRRAKTTRRSKPVVYKPAKVYSAVPTPDNSGGTIIKQAPQRSVAAPLSKPVTQSKVTAFVPLPE